MFQISKLTFRALGSAAPVTAAAMAVAAVPEAVAPAAYSMNTERDHALCSSYSREFPVDSLS